MSQYAIDAASGALTPLNPATAATGPGPYDLAISSDEAFLYVASWGSNTISPYSIDATTGLLRSLSPATVATQSNPFAITLTP